MMQATKKIKETENKGIAFASHVHGNQRQAVLLSYIAGIIDGEGSIRINRFNPSPKTKMINKIYYAQLNLGMVERQIPELLKSVFGAGSVRKELVPEKRSIWRYSLSGRAKIINVLNALMPYLRVKKEHAEVAIDFCKNWKTPYSRMKGIDPQELQRREDVFQIMRKLNAVGAAATTKRESIREDEAIV